MFILDEYVKAITAEKINEEIEKAKGKKGKSEGFMHPGGGSFNLDGEAI